MPQDRRQQLLIASGVAAALILGLVAYLVAGGGKSNKESLNAGVTTTAVPTTVGAVSTTTPTTIPPVSVTAPAAFPPDGPEVNGSALTALSFGASTDVGYGLYGSPPRLARTKDGGKTWHLTGDYPGQVTHVRFAGPFLGYAWGSTTWMETTDGGATWKHVPVPFGSGQVVFDVQVFGTSAAALLGCPGGCSENLWTSQDSGKTWQAPGFAGYRGESGSLDLTAAGQGFVVSSGYSDSRPARLASLGPAGTNELTDPCSGSVQSQQIGALSTTDLWLLCFGGSGKQVYRSNDGGQQWTLASTISQSGVPNAFIVADDQDALVGLAQMGVVGTTDGAKTWHPAFTVRAGAAGPVVLTGVAGSTQAWAIAGPYLWHTADFTGWKKL